MFSVEGRSFTNGLAIGAVGFFALLFTFIGSMLMFNAGANDNFNWNIAIVGTTGLIGISLLFVGIKVFMKKRIETDLDSIRIYHGKNLKREIPFSDVSTIRVNWEIDFNKQVETVMDRFLGFTIIVNRVKKEEITIGTSWFISDGKKLLEVFKELVRTIHWQNLGIKIE